MISARLKPQRKLFLVLIPVAVFGLFFVLAHLNLLRIKNLSLTLDNVPCASEESVKDAAHLQNQSILFINSQAVQRVLNAKFLCINKVEIAKTSLDSIKVNVTGRQALFRISSASESSAPAQFTDDFINQLEEASSSSQSAAIASIDYQTDLLDHVASNNENFLTDQTGLLFYQASPSFNLREVTFIHPQFHLGDRIDPKQAQEIEMIFTKLQGLSIPVNSLRVRDATAVVNSQNPKYLLFNLGDGVDRQLASLQLILKQITMDPGGENSSATGTKSIQSIDFRFDKPVLTYSSK